MLRTYVVADLKLFDKAGAKKFHMTMEQFNQFLINKINKVADKDDYIVLIGIVTCGSIIGTLYYLNQIKAKKQVLDKKSGIWFKDCLGDSWKDNFDYIFDYINDVTEGTINGKGETIVIPNSIEQFDLMRQLDYVYIAAPNSFLNREELYKNKILNISIEEWNYEPIELGTRLPQIFDDMELFATMKNKEETLN